MDRFDFCMWLLGGALGPPLLASTAHAQVAGAAKLDVPAAVDLAGRLRMLSQRTTKAYLQWGQSIAAEEARPLLHDSVARFASHLAALKGFAPQVVVQERLVALEARWSDFQSLLLAGEPHRHGATALYDASELLQTAAHRTTLAYEHLTSSPFNQWIGIAGRQRMLSQRMAKFYLFRTWDIHDSAAGMELHLSRAHFTAVLKQLEGARLLDSQVRSAATRLRSVWKPCEEALFAEGTPAQLRLRAERVAGDSERVLAATEEVVALLVAQAREQQG